MRFQLTVFTLLILSTLLLSHLIKVFSGPQPRTGSFGGQGAPKKGAAELLEKIYADALWSYVPFAAITLVMFSWGKPGLLPQYAGWGVVFFQGLRGLLTFLDSPAILRRVTGILVLIALIYLWVLQLPVFDPLPA